MEKSRIRKEKEATGVEDTDDTALLEPCPIPLSDDDDDDDMMKETWAEVARLMPNGQFGGTEEELAEIMEDIQEPDGANSND